MSARPTVILSTDAPDGPLAVLAETHPDLRVLGCDSYEALPGMISETGAEVVFTIKFDRGSGDEVIIHRADLDLIDICRKVNFNFALYRRPDQYLKLTEPPQPD